jgi:hypothetical protein
MQMQSAVMQLDSQPDARILEEAEAQLADALQRIRSLGSAAAQAQR